LGDKAVVSMEVFVCFCGFSGIGVVDGELFGEEPIYAMMLCCV